jgi:hypothetical protein
LISLETADFFRGAFLLCIGGDIAEVRVYCRWFHQVQLNCGRDADQVTFFEYWVTVD